MLVPPTWAVHRQKIKPVKVSKFLLGMTLSLSPFNILFGMALMLGKKYAANGHQLEKDRRLAAIQILTARQVGLNI
jgi:hypothetical protein